MGNFDFDGHKLFYHFDTAARVLRGELVTPLYMEISPTGCCNHRCIFCAYDYLGYQSRFLDTGKTVDAIRELGRRGLKALMFAGEGEPLSHPGIADMLRAAHESGIDAGMYSNGALLDPTRAEAILPHLTFLRISCNGGTAEVYKKVHGRDDFERLHDNLRYAIALKKRLGLKVDIGMQSVVIPENVHTMVDLARMGRELELAYFVIKPFVQHPDQKGYKFAQNFSLDDVAHLLDEAESLGTPTYRVIGRKEAFRKYHERTYDHCLALTLFGVILSDGRVFSCGPFLGQDEFCYGSIADQSMAEILDGKRRREILEHARTQLDCKNRCMKNCRMDAINRSLWELTHPTVAHVNFI